MAKEKVNYQEVYDLYHDIGTENRKTWPSQVV